MNEQKKAPSRKVHFNILDGVIVLLVVLCIVGIVFRHNIMDSIGLGKDMSKYMVKFDISCVDSDLPDFLIYNKKLYSGDSREMGRLCKVDDFSDLTPEQAGSRTLVVRPASMYIDNGKGEIVVGQYPENTKIDASGAFICNGTFSDDGKFELESNKFISVGQKLSVYTDAVTLHITINAIEPVK